MRSGRRRAAGAGIQAALLAILAVLAVLAVFGAGAPAGATLVEWNDPSLGNPPDDSGLTDDANNLTRDTATSLDWLDLHLTDSLSHDAVQAGPFVQSEGFRYATTAEVAALFEAAGLVDGNGDVYTSASANLLNPASLTALGLDLAGFLELFGKVEALVLKLGVTGGSTDDRNNYTIGITGTPDPLNPGSRLVAGLWVNYSASYQPNAFSIWIGPNSISAIGSIGTGGASGQVGSFLVGQVPEPAAATLLALGLGALGVARRRG